VVCVPICRHRKARTNAELDLVKCQSVLAARGIEASSGVEAGNDVAGNIVEAIERERRCLPAIVREALASPSRNEQKRSYNSPGITPFCD
jgi:hypothetical protein